MPGRVEHDREERSAAFRRTAAVPQGLPLRSDSRERLEAPERRVTGFSEFDRVTGGGLVAGSALLLGGDPGVGKSTLVLQALAAYARKTPSVVYVSGEEALDQVRLRAARMGVANAPVQLGTATCVEDILATLAAGPVPDILAVDSIQTLWTSALDAAPGTIAQVRTATHDLVRYAKASGTAVIFVGHVTKDGQIAGPKAVEHLVDAVLYFEGERGMPFRILRAVKNRFGPTDEIGVFEMTEAALKKSAIPPRSFSRPYGSFRRDRSLRRHRGHAPTVVGSPGPGGTAVLRQPTPRRRRLGCRAACDDPRRARCTSRPWHFGTGYLSERRRRLKIAEPAADLAAAAALISSHTGRALPKDCVVFGEIALSGDVRPATQTDSRLKEAAKLGFGRALVPTGTKSEGLAVELISDVGALVRLLDGT